MARSQYNIYLVFSPCALTDVKVVHASLRALLPLRIGFMCHMSSRVLDLGRVVARERARGQLVEGLMFENYAVGPSAAVYVSNLLISCQALNLGLGKATWNTK